MIGRLSPRTAIVAGLLTSSVATQVLAGFDVPTSAQLIYLIVASLTAGTATLLSPDDDIKKASGSRSTQGTAYSGVGKDLLSSKFGFVFDITRPFVLSARLD